MLLWIVPLRSDDFKHTVYMAVHDGPKLPSADLSYYLCCRPHASTHAVTDARRDFLEASNIDSHPPTVWHKNTITETEGQDSRHPTYHMHTYSKTENGEKRLLGLLTCLYHSRLYR